MPNSRLFLVWLIALASILAFDRAARASSIAVAATATAPGAPLNAVQFNSPLGTFAGSANFTWDGTTLTVASTGSAVPRGIVSAQYSTDNASARISGYKARGTSTIPTIVVSGDLITRYSGFAYDGANFLECASILQSTEGTVAVTRTPTNTTFSTCTDAAPSVLTEVMRMNSAQNIGIGTGATITAAFHISRNGALSTGNGPAFKADGTWITGGSATTTKPYFLIEPAGTNSTAWNTNGTGIGINAAAGFTGQLLSLQVAGSPVLTIANSGSLSTISQLQAGASSDIGWNGRSFFHSGADGVILAYNNAGTNFTRFQFGTATATGPALGTTIQTNPILTVMDATGGLTGQLRSSWYGSVGTVPGISGCSAGTQTGGASAGTFSSGTTGACTVTLTFGVTAPTGWFCAASDRTTPANLISQSASSTTTCTVTGTTVSGDVIGYSAHYY